MSANYQAGINADFAARLARVKAGGLGTNRTIFVGIDDAFCVPKNHSFTASVSSKPERTKIRPLALMMAFALGLLAFAFGQYLRFRTLSDLELEGQIDMIANVGIGVMVGYILTQTFGLSGKLQQVTQGLGVFAGLCTFHNVVHWYPQMFQTVFSPEWVITMINTTEPNSIVFRGVTYVLGT